MSILTIAMYLQLSIEINSIYDYDPNAIIFMGSTTGWIHDTATRLGKIIGLGYAVELADCAGCLWGCWDVSFQKYRTLSPNGIYGIADEDKEAYEEEKAQCINDNCDGCDNL